MGSPTDHSLPHDITDLEERVQEVERAERKVRETAGQCARLNRLTRDQLDKLNAKEAHHKEVVSRLLKNGQLLEALVILEQRADDRFYGNTVPVPEDEDLMVGLRKKTIVMTIQAGDSHRATEILLERLNKAADRISRMNDKLERSVRIGRAALESMGLKDL